MNYVGLRFGLALLRVGRRTVEADSKRYRITEITSSKTAMKEKIRKIVKGKIDVTRFLIWFVEDWPESKKNDAGKSGLSGPI